uniref:Regulator of G-protein signaling 16 n=1 Tax=Gopherus evgoodei TaxID=1825980 RepID=A0A8C4WIX9_9SAUR
MEHVCFCTACDLFPVQLSQEGESHHSDVLRYSWRAYKYLDRSTEICSKAPGNRLWRTIIEGQTCRTCWRHRICPVPCLSVGKWFIGTQRPINNLRTVESLQDGVATFHAFLKTEFSEENLEFWLACEEFKKSRSKTKLSSKAHRIFKEFVQNEAPKEVNIDHETREITRKNLTAATTTCFDAAQAKTRTLMEKDSYPRFLKSTSYQGLTEQVISHSTSKRLHT